jgi:hypothetical protein
MKAALSKSLVLVVGAGGSKEVDLPLGSELKVAIARALSIRYEDGVRRVSGDGLIDSALRSVDRFAGGGGFNDFLHAARRIAGAMPQALSIDNFIDSHKGDGKIALCGKLAIVRAILDAERSSKLYIDRQNAYNKLPFENVGSTWFNVFFQLVTENCHRDDLRERLSKVAIVTFNYDRCIEHYLYEGLQNYYGMPAEDAKAVLACLEIYHPYGSVGQLEWQSLSGISFGGVLDEQKLVQLVGEIRTFTEGVDPKLGESNAIRTSLAQAKRIVFLGFAFHRLNMELLFEGPNTGAKLRRCPTYATSLGLSVADVNLIANELSNLAMVHSDDLHLDNSMSCAELLRKYWRSLSLI